MSQEDRSCVRDADFDGLFDDLGDGSERDEEVLAKAQANAVRRISALIRTPD